jgi:diketogulonate reductase-like aldo/keto reductase
LLHQPQTVVIPKSARIQRNAENLAAVQIELGDQDLRELDAGFPSPTAPVRLGMR